METSFLSSDARIGIQSLQRFDSLLSRTSERLATGLKINRASDGPSSYFTARSLNNRAGDLNRVLDGIGTKLGTIQAADNGLQALESLVRVGQSIADTAAALPANSPERAAKAAEFDSLRTQINQLAADSSFLGINLLAGDSPVVQLNEDGSSSLTLTGSLSDASGLGIAPAANNFQTDADISAAQAGLSGALDSIRSTASQFSTSLAVIDVRREFTEDLRNVLQAGADSLTVADLNEEAASLLAVQTRSSLAAASFSIIQQSESNVLRLFA